MKFTAFFVGGGIFVKGGKFFRIECRMLIFCYKCDKIIIVYLILAKMGYKLERK